MREYVFGANILENLTTGMYQDSRVIYREYIQNACDSIDKAVREGILGSEDGAIEVWLDHPNRTISIEDNAMGIPASDFERVLGNIADSDKRVGEDKGFRGIGRLCGLAYCSNLVFRSTVKGETQESIMICDAEKMRELIADNRRGKKRTASEVLHAINEFQVRAIDDVDSHYFRVELIGINDENTDLLDTRKVKDYLSFVAPVQYQNTFIYRTNIYDYAREIGCCIDEYNIKLDGESIFKKYVTGLRDPKGLIYDDIFDVGFKDFFDEDGNLIAWAWIGLTQFRKAIPKANQMRGLRLRKENIQIGGEDTLQKLFKEDRGNNYFVGEVFAISPELIPNSQRDYFNENQIRADFEKALRRYFNDELHKIYNSGSTVNAAYKKINVYAEKQKEFQEKAQSGLFIDSIHQEDELRKLESAEKDASAARETIEKEKTKADKISPLMGKVIQRIANERVLEDVNRVAQTPSLTPDISETPKRRTDPLSAYSKKEKKLIQKIFSIIYRATDKGTAQIITDLIVEELK